ncbi:prephenate dehydrogenase [Virgibacillus sp. NKC19-3]|uniref:prephenate dehydrogenase n=1 Tax=Virgibacillus saliphilus TaxID=2831674 RepID=UPI001C9B7B4B|nr:prephenate dehydrogenase [Virgibacillus sp. NKC19-3]MBY7143494.1 prephenate dehydrogenase [Virgibacillus sp. NKC19-3]
MTQTIVIAGLGLIGGSLAKSIYQSNQNHVVGYDINAETLEYALINEFIHEASTDFTQATRKADYIIFAAPISETIRLMQELDTFVLDHDIIVSDVSSVKNSILETANNLSNKHITFIGGHPMAGSHKKGIEAAKGHLFENAIYVLTPSTRSSQAKVESLKQVLKNTKSNFIILDPNDHDEMTGVVSHFPHLIASSLVHQAKKWEDKHAFLPTLAAGGFRDVTRIASSNPEMWQDIFYHNRFKMSRMLEEWITEMSSLKELVDNDDKTTMMTYLKNAKDYRDGLGKMERGAIPAFYDLYVDIQDQPGALASVTRLLADEKISIRNIQILEIREGITGALRLSFPSQKLQKQSHTLLQTHGYEVMIQK